MTRVATTSPPAAHAKALPTFRQAARIIDIHPSGITRLVQRLGIQPVEWGNRDKRLRVGDVLTIAVSAKRAALEEVADGLIALAEAEQPDRVADVEAEIERFFAALPLPEPSPTGDVIADLRKELPPKWADRAIAIYQRYLPAGDAQ